MLHKMGSLPKLRTPRAPLPPGAEASMLSPTQSLSASACGMQAGLRSQLASPSGSLTGVATPQHSLAYLPAQVGQAAESGPQAQPAAEAHAVQHSQVSPSSARPRSSNFRLDHLQPAPRQAMLTVERFAAAVTGFQGGALRWEQSGLRVHDWHSWLLLAG